MTLFTEKKHRQAGKASGPTPVKGKHKLSRAGRKQIEAAIARANRTDKKEKSAQDSIPYERMWPDGICKVAVIRPKERPYKTNNFYAVLERQEKLDKEVYDIVHSKEKPAGR